MLAGAARQPTHAHTHILLRTHARTHTCTHALPQVVLRRQWSLMTKDLSLLRGRLVQTVVIGLIVGGLFFNLQPTADDVAAFMGCCFLMIM